ncbi:hypothetical protein [Leptospira alstonii]|nr:hypothetical protein [Leptospira alstonii]
MNSMMEVFTSSYLYLITKMAPNVSEINDVPLGNEITFANFEAGEVM